MSLTEIFWGVITSLFIPILMIYNFVYLPCLILKDVLKFEVKIIFNNHLNQTFLSKMSLTEFFYGVIFKWPNGQFPLKKRFFGYIYTKLELFLVFIIKKIICYFYLIKEREENKKIFFFHNLLKIKTMCYQRLI